MQKPYWFWAEEEYLELVFSSDQPLEVVKHVFRLVRESESISVKDKVLASNRPTDYMWPMFLIGEIFSQAVAEGCDVVIDYLLDETKLTDYYMPMLQYRDYRAFRRPEFYEQPDALKTLQKLTKAYSDACVLKEALAGKDNQYDVLLVAIEKGDKKAVNFITELVEEETKQLEAILLAANKKLGVRSEAESSDIAEGHELHVALECPAPLVGEKDKSGDEDLDPLPSPVLSVEDSHEGLPARRSSGGSYGDNLNNFDFDGGGGKEESGGEELEPLPSRVLSVEDSHEGSPARRSSGGSYGDVFELLSSSASSVGGKDESGGEELDHNSSPVLSSKDSREGSLTRSSSGSSFGDFDLFTSPASKSANPSTLMETPPPPPPVSLKNPLNLFGGS